MRLKLSVREVSKSYNGVAVLNRCSQGFSHGVTAIKGSSQSGKTTLLKIFALLEPPTSGRVGYYYSADKALAHDLKLMRKISLVLPYGTIFNTSAWNNVTAGLKIRAVKRREIKSRAAEMLNAVGLYEKRKRNAFSLTRGECRRMLLARALAFDPDVLLLDEPTRGLDEESNMIIEKVILSLKRLSDQPTIVMTTVDGELAERLADRVLILRHGTIALSTQTASLDDYGIKADTLSKGLKKKRGGYYVDPRFFND